MSKRVCAEPGCPTLTDTTRCPAHTRARDKQRGTKQERGYDTSHDRMRAIWQQRLDSGESITCRNPWCQTPDVLVNPKDWTLGHTPDRTTWRGPEHPLCNYSEAGKARHGIPPPD